MVAAKHASRTIFMHFWSVEPGLAKNAFVSAAAHVVASWKVRICQFIKWFFHESAGFAGNDRTTRGWNLVAMLLLLLSTLLVVLASLLIGGATRLFLLKVFGRARTIFRGHCERKLRNLLLGLGMVQSMRNIYNCKNVLGIIQIFELLLGEPGILRQPVLSVERTAFFLQVENMIFLNAKKVGMVGNFVGGKLKQLFLEKTLRKKRMFRK